MWFTELLQLFKYLLGFQPLEILKCLLCLKFESILTPEEHFHKPKLIPQPHKHSLKKQKHVMWHFIFH